MNACSILSPHLQKQLCWENCSEGVAWQFTSSRWRSSFTLGKKNLIKYSTVQQKLRKGPLCNFSHTIMKPGTLLGFSHNFTC